MEPFLPYVAAVAVVLVPLTAVLLRRARRRDRAFGKHHTQGTGHGRHGEEGKALGGAANIGRIDGTPG